MSSLNDIPISALSFYLTAPYPCSYLPGMQARSQVATPGLLINSPLYSQLVQHSFRRSGTYVYRPRCDLCHECIQSRVITARFTANRTQRRAWKQHKNLSASLHPLQEKPEYYELYQRYQRARHPDGGMDNDDYEAYQTFLLQSLVDTVLVEFREGDILRMVSVIDLLGDGLSSVYTFYEPDLPQARFGVYNVLWQIELCRKLNLNYLYLGYWIKNSRKMSYKTQYQPAQGLIDGTWIPLTTNN
ncbi:MAG: arginyltransferase [Gallionellales bacterium RIFOXYB12_FULL_54_9]|nr:MAG: arginyltransferase [Gallionellales bacterium RIFOXYB12_FULL_54_9]